MPSRTRAVPESVRYFTLAVRTSVVVLMGGVVRDRVRQLDATQERETTKRSADVTPSVCADLKHQRHVIALLRRRIMTSTSRQVGIEPLGVQHATRDTRQSATELQRLCQRRDCGELLRCRGKGCAEVNICKGTTPNSLTGSPLGHLGILSEAVVQQPLQPMRILEFVVRRRDDLDTISVKMITDSRRHRQEDSGRWSSNASSQTHQGDHIPGALRRKRKGTFGGACCRSRGRWSEETAQFLRALAKANAQTAPLILQNRVKAVWLRRWSGVLACSAARAFAWSLLDKPANPQCMRC